MSDNLLDPDHDDRTAAYDYYPVLSRGVVADASAVVMLQSLLNQHGVVPPLVEDGAFGQRTEGAVQAFQGRRGITPTGRVDRETWQQLLSGTDLDI